MRNKFKLNYITIPSWWDTDVTLLPSLIKNNIEINLIVIIPHINSKYSVSEINHFCLTNNIKVDFLIRKKRIGHISNIWIALRVCAILLRNKSKDHTWTFFEYFTDPYLNIFLLLVNKNKALISFHNYKEHSGQSGNIIDIFFKSIYLKKFKLFHLHSEEQFKLFNKDFLDKESVFTTMPLKDFGMPESNELKKHLNSTNFLFFGYIKEYKNLNFLIESFERLENKNTTLTIAGNCDDFGKYDRLIIKRDQYNLNIRFIENKEISAFFLNADFLVLPYVDSTQSGPMLIALNYNLPIIASNVEPFNNIIENKIDGLLFDLNDNFSMTETLKLACEIKETKYESMRLNQKIKIDHYSELSQNNGYKLYNFILNHEQDKSC